MLIEVWLIDSFELDRLNRNCFCIAFNGYVYHPFNVIKKDDPQEIVLLKLDIQFDEPFQILNSLHLYMTSLQSVKLIEGFSH